MNFPQHLKGGIVCSVVIGITAFVYDKASDLIELSNHQLGLMFLLPLVFALFPDLDISSIPQRIYFRLLFLTLIYLTYKELYLAATMISIVSITPLLSHHRQWTHNWISPILFPMFILFLWEFFRYKTEWFRSLSVEQFESQVITNVHFLIACACGWYTHLVLDMKILRKKSNLPKGQNEYF